MTCGFVIILLVTYWSITIISSGPIEPFQINQFDNYPSSGDSTEIQPDDNSGKYKKKHVKNFNSQQNVFGTPDTRFLLILFNRLIILNKMN